MERTNVLEEPTAYNAVQADQDGLWKKLIRELFEEFMQFFAPTLYHKIDFTNANPEFLQQELFQEIMNDRSGRAYTDQIVKVVLKNGEEKWVWVHIEIQGVADKEFPLRMFRYFYKIYDQFGQNIYAIALLTDSESSTDHTQFQYSYYGTELRYKYNVYEFHGRDINELEQSPNPFASAVIAGIYASKSKHDAEKRYSFKRKLMIEVLKKYANKQESIRLYLSSLFYFIDYLLLVPEDLKKQLSEEIRPLIQKEAYHTMRAEKEKLPPTLAELFAEGREEGREEGRMEGRKEGKSEALKVVVQGLLRGGFSDAQISNLTNMSIEEVINIRKTLQ